MIHSLKNSLIAFLIISMVACFFPAEAFAASDSAGDIKYSVDSDDSLDFKEDDFNKACKDLNAADLDYVKFTLPDDDDGILYYNYDEDDDDNTKVSESKKYYYSGSSSSRLSKITFVPDEDCSGTVTIKYNGCSKDDDTYTGRIKITVKDTGSSKIIKYSADKKEPVEFSKNDFRDACDDIQNEDLDYVKFTLPDEDDGVLYYNYDKDSGSNTKVSLSKKYYYDSSNSQSIKNVTFVPDKDFSGTVTIKYTGYDDTGDSYSGKVQITIGNSSSSSSDGTVSYTVSSSKDTVKFDEDDFNKVSKKINDEDLDYIKITIPSASKGILYYDYSNGSYSSIVSSGNKYYYDNTSPYIKKITFVPKDGFNGTCKIDYTGYDTDGKTFSGTISITVGSASSSQTAGIIKYTSRINAITAFKDSDFNDVCKSLTGNQLNYVKFTLPSESSGTLYYGYNANGSYDSKIKSSTEYYYSGTPYLLSVSFVPAANYSGMITIDYTGYDKDGRSYDGKIQITLASDTTTVPIPTPAGITLQRSKYFSDVDEAYSWAVPYIDNLYETGVITGAASGSSKLYSPAAYVTRGDFIYLLYKALNFKTTTTTTGFSDVPSGSYYYTAINTAKALGIIQGSDNKFSPSLRITREDAMVMVLRAVNITGKTIASGDVNSLSAYSDGSSISDYSKSAVAALIKAKIITGSDDNKIYPQGNLSRAQIAAIIYRAKNL